MLIAASAKWATGLRHCWQGSSGCHETLQRSAAAEYIWLIRPHRKVCSARASAEGCGFSLSPTWLCRKLYREAVDVAEESDNTNCEVFVEPDGQVTQVSAPEGHISPHIIDAADRREV